MRLPKIRSQISALGVIATLVFSLVLLSIPIVSAAHFVHGAIYIYGDSQFTSANGVTSGVGTPSNPYIIENWLISDFNTTGIFIRDTTAYFIIRSCIINSSGASSTGIVLYDAKNGRVENNICTGGAYGGGIWLDGSASYETIVYNVCTYGTYGIFIGNNAVYDNFWFNTCENNTYGIYAYDTAKANLITGNHLLTNIVNNAGDEGANNWIGNWWSDWQPGMVKDGVTLTSTDGRVDQPRPIAEGSNQDSYCLVMGMTSGLENIPSPPQENAPWQYHYPGAPTTALPVIPSTTIGTPGAIGLIALFLPITGGDPVVAGYLVGIFFFILPLTIGALGVVGAGKSGKYGGMLIIIFFMLGVFLCIMLQLFPLWFIIFLIALISLILAKDWI